MVRAWWTLVRGTNLIFVCAIPVLLHFFFLEPSFDVALTSLQIWILALSIVFIAAAGYIINDIYDQSADRINKPSKLIVGEMISESTALKAFGVFAFLGLGLGAYLAIQIDEWNYTYVHAISLVILWLYAMDFKSRVLIGNLLISILASLNVLVVALFDLFPTLDRGGTYQSLALSILGFLAVFAFIATLLREIIKDLEDVEGDKRAGYKTIATQWPLLRVKAIIVSTALLEVAGLVWLSYKFQDSTAILLWINLALVGSLVFALYYALTGNTKKNYHRASSIMKLHMLLGLLSPIIIIYISK